LKALHNLKRCMGNARGRAPTVEVPPDCVANSRRCSSGCGCRRCLGRIAEVLSTLHCLKYHALQVPASPRLSLHKQLLASLLGVSCLPQELAQLIVSYAASPGRVVLGVGCMLYLVEADSFHVNAQVNVGNSIGAIMLLSDSTICVCSKEFDSWSSGEGFAIKSFSLPTLRPERALAIDQEFFDPNWLPLKYNEEGAWLQFKKKRVIRLFSSRFSSKCLDKVSASLAPQLLFDGRIVVVDRQQLAVHAASVSSWRLVQVLPSVQMASPVLAFTVFSWGALVVLASRGQFTLFQVGKFGLAVQRSWYSPALSQLLETDSVMLAPLAGLFPFFFRLPSELLGGQVGVVVGSRVVVVDVEGQDRVQMTHGMLVDAVCVLPNEVTSTGDLGVLGTVTYPEC